MSSQLFVTLYTLSIYSSAHKLLRIHRPNLLREFPCILIIIETPNERLKTRQSSLFKEHPVFLLWTFALLSIFGFKNIFIIIVCFMTIFFKIFIFQETFPFQDSYSFGLTKIMYPLLKSFIKINKLLAFLAYITYFVCTIVKRYT